MTWIGASTAALAAVVLSAGCGSAEPGAGAAHGSAALGTRSGAAASGRSAGRAFFPDGPRRRAVVWAFGDGAPGPGAASVARLLSRSRADVVLYLGDVYPMGTAAAFRGGYAPAFGRFAARTAPTPGNHDWPVRAGGYDAYWRSIRGRTPPDWYSFAAGGWRILSLNSETGARSAQLRWLHEQLRSPGDCRIAFWHRPRFSAGPHGDATSMQPFWHALEGHARLVLSGHDHDMERLRPRGGLVQLVAGAGGHSHYPLTRTYPGLAFGDERDYGALRIELAPGSARLEFRAADGRRLDAARVSCRG